MAFEFIYGHWSVLEAMRAGRRKLEQLLVSDTIEEKGSVAEILTTAADRGIPIKRVPRRIIDDTVQGAGHQGTALRTGPYPYAQTDDVLNVSKTRNEKPFVLLLDLVKDPQNAGALLRVADAVGIHGIFIQERRGVEITPSVVNASSGAVEHLNVVQVVNLVQTMKELKEKDIWMIGLDAGPNVPPLDKTDLNMNLGLVLGSEGEGLRKLVRDTCDLVLCLPMRGRVASLNVATAGSVALYHAWRARGWEGWAHAGK